MNTNINALVLTAASLAFIGCSVEPVDEIYAEGQEALSTDATNVATVRIHRAFNAAMSDHVMGTIANEGAPAWVYDGVAFSLYANSSIADSGPVYRCVQRGSWHHFLSTGRGCEGHTLEGLIGYLSTTRRDGLVPLYRCIRLGTNDHLSTTSLGECDRAGFVPDVKAGAKGSGLQGYVLP